MTDNRLSRKVLRPFARGASRDKHARTGASQSLARFRVVQQRVGQVSQSTHLRVVALTATEAALAAVFALVTARALGPADRGVVVILTTVSSFLMLLGSFGSSTGGRMLLSQRAPDYDVRRHLEVTIRLSAAHVITMVALGWVLLAVTHAWRGWFVGVMFAAYGVAMVTILLLREALHGIGAHIRASLSGVMLNGFVMGGLLVVEVFGDVTVESVITLLLLGALGDVAYLAVQLVKSMPPKRYEVPRSMKALLALSAPALLASAGQALTIRGDRLLLGALADPHAVGIYGTAATFAELMWLIPMGVGQVIFRQAALGNVEKVRKLQALTFAGMVVFAGGAALVAKPATRILLGSEYAESVPLIWGLLIAALPMGIYHLNAPILNGSGDLRGPAIATGASAVVLFTVCLATIPALGAFGAVIGSFAAYSLMAVVVTIRSRRVIARRG